MPINQISVTANNILMAQARASLKNRWGLAIGTWVALVLATGLTQVIPVVGDVLCLLISGPLALGWAIFALRLSRNQGPTLKSAFEGFRLFGTALAAYLLTAILVLLWALLLIVPGIIAALAYSQTFYILADDADLGPLDAIRKSKEMMGGNKGKFFCLGLRFIGWSLLCVVTLGIGFLWLIPYMSVATAKFYDDIRRGAPPGKEDVEQGTNESSAVPLPSHDDDRRGAPG